MSNSQRASIISNALLSIVAESIVIFAPMCQRGCLSACWAVAEAIASCPNVRNGPPEAVIISLLTVSLFSPTRHWYMAECSESTGITLDDESVKSLLTSSPATTSVSLLANAICFPVRMARIVGNKPL